MKMYFEEIYDYQSTALYDPAPVTYPIRCDLAWCTTYQPTYMAASHPSVANKSSIVTHPVQWATVHDS